MIAAAAIAVGLTAAGVGLAQAANNTNNPMNNLVSAIATKFNLNPSDVQQVFDDQHTQMEAQHEQLYKDYLAGAVKDGKLSQDQVDKLIAKHDELEAQRDANRDEFQNKTFEERKAIRDQQRADLEQWAKDNNIPTQYLRFGFGPGRGHGMGPRGDADGDGFGPGMMGRGMGMGFGR